MHANLTTAHSERPRQNVFIDWGGLPTLWVRHDSTVARIAELGREASTTPAPLRKKKAPTHLGNIIHMRRRARSGYSQRFFDNVGDCREVQSSCEEG